MLFFQRIFKHLNASNVLVFRLLNYSSELLIKIFFYDVFLLKTQLYFFTPLLQLQPENFVLDFEVFDSREEDLPLALKLMFAFLLQTIFLSVLVTQSTWKKVMKVMLGNQAGNTDSSMENTNKIRLVFEDSFECKHILCEICDVHISFVDYIQVECEISFDLF